MNLYSSQNRDKRRGDDALWMVIAYHPAVYAEFTKVVKRLTRMLVKDAFSDFLPVRASWRNQAPNLAMRVAGLNDVR